jgi:hypothetical protein
LEENPYKSPHHADTSVEASLEEGEEILFQIAARSMSKRSWFFRDCNNVIGKFIVTNRRVMFLSSGRYTTFGITGLSMLRWIANSVDFAAMSKRSSWEIELSDVRSAGASKHRIWLEPKLHLELVGTPTCGMEARHRVYPYGVKRKTWEELVTRINEMTQGGGQDGSGS